MKKELKINKKIIILKNIQIALAIYQLPDVFSQILLFTNFIPFIKNFISPYIINQLVIAIKNQNNDFFNVLFKDLYLSIAATA